MRNKKLLGLSPSDEQWDIIEDIKEGKSVFQNSVAGSSKSTTFYMCAKESPNTKFLLLTFMSKLAKESDKELKKNGIRNVTTRTIHSLASKAILVKKNFKLIKYIDFKEAREVIGCSYQATKPIVDEYIEWVESIRPLEDLTDDCRLLHEHYIANKECTHSMYLKLYVMDIMAGKTESLSPYDCIVIDEINDANAVMVEIQKAAGKDGKQIVAIGDCLSKDCKLKTDKGWLRISNIYTRMNTNNEDFKVESYNQATGEFEMKRAYNCVRKEYDKPMLKIKTLAASVEVTKEHRMLMSDNTYKTAGKLTKTDLLMSSRSAMSALYVDKSSKVYQFLIGTALLGDEHINNKSYSDTGFRVSLNHCKKQFEYIDFIKSEILQGYTVQDAKYLATRKIVIDGAIDISYMNALGLALWIMDDGSVYHSSNKSKLLEISTNSETLEMNNLLVKLLKDNFKVDATVHPTREYYRLRFNKENTLKVLELIQPYLLDCFPNMKLSSEASNVTLPLEDFKYAVPIVAIEEFNFQVKKTHKTNYVYDISVEDNHNFSVSLSANLVEEEQGKLIAHNCKQSIMGFSLKGYSAFNDEEYLKMFTHRELTQSFRCSITLADFVEKFLNKWMRTESCKPIMFKGFADTDKYFNGSYGVLNRTNAGTIPNMVSIAEQEITMSTSSVNIEELFYTIYTMAKMLKSSYLVKTSMSNKEITALTGINDYYVIDQMKLYSALTDEVNLKIGDFIDEYMSNEYRTAVAILTKYFGKLDELKAKLLKYTKPNALTLVSTVHRSKGLTLDRVTIGGFESLEEIILRMIKKDNPHLQEVTKEQVLDMLVFGQTTATIAAREEFNLIYVGLTRSRGRVSLSSNGFKLKDLHDIDGVIAKVNKLLCTGKNKR